MRAVLFAVLALASIAHAAPVSGPSEVTVAVGRLASVPLTVDADEADYVVLGSDVDAFREFSPDPKQLRLRVIGYAPGTAYVTVASVKAGKLQPLHIVKVVIGGGPAPVPPGPTPPGPTPPDPKPPEPAPIPGDGLRVLIMYESKDLNNLPSAQVQALSSQNVREYLERKCPKGPDGKTAEYRIWDKDTAADGESLTWRVAFKRAKDKSDGKTPWVVISNGKTGYEGMLPANAADLLTLLKKYGGD